MSDEVARRGPDGAGAWAGAGVALAHRRLAIIDLSSRGAQPMVDSELGLAAVFNGCIYNHHELRAQLAGEGYRFFSTSDTEVLLKAWHRWDDRFVDRLAGMFAFCLVDTESGRALLGRDRLGIKPLYLATERTPALRLHAAGPARRRGIDISIDPVALHHYLTCTRWCRRRDDPERCAQARARTLLAVEADAAGTRPSTGARSSAARPGGPRSEEEWEQAVLERLRIAVERRMWPTCRRRPPFVGSTRA